MNASEQMIIESLARALGLPLDQVMADIAQHAAARRARIARKNARFDAALQKLSAAQVALVDKLEREGAALDKLFVNRRTGNVAVMMVKSRIYNSANGRYVTRLTIVYPDGSSGTTLERSLSLKDVF